VHWAGTVGAELSARASIIAAAEVTDAGAISSRLRLPVGKRRFCRTRGVFRFQPSSPASDNIRLMGDKVAAKQAMIEAKVPCVPGSDGRAAGRSG